MIEYQEFDMHIDPIRKRIGFACQPPRHHIGDGSRKIIMDEEKSIDRFGSAS